MGKMNLEGSRRSFGIDENQNGYQMPRFFIL